MTQTATDGEARLAEQSGKDQVFLKSGTKLEPLVCGWYAWSHLMAPAQHAMNVACRYIPLMQSFVMNPSVHVAATQDPKLFGGPFVSLAKSDVPQVKQLLAETQRRCAELLTLANDLKALDGLLQDGANGHSLNEYYKKLPDSLKGLVELVYDTNNHPKLRLIEELLYDDDLSAESQEISLSSLDEGERTFFMSTPRLQSPQNLILKMRFSDKRLDKLAATRTQPHSLKALADQFEVPEENLPLFASFFTSEAPARNEHQYVGNGVRVRYFGHACVLVQTDEVSILIDPMLAWDTHHNDQRYTFNDLPDFIDYVILTHNHQDHCSPEMLLQLRHRVGKVVIPRNNAGCIADPSMKLILKQMGFENIEVVDAFDEIKVPGGAIVSLPFPGEHVDLDIYTKHAIHIRIKERKLLFLVDSDCWDSALYRRVVRRIGNEMDAVFIGMECFGAPLTWLYGPLLTKAISRRDDESRRLSGANFERAWNVVQEVATPRVFVYAMGQEPWLRYIMGLEYTPESIQLQEMGAFLDKCNQAGIEAQQLNISSEMTL
ncbi:MAG: MBL fold metallo-hydrolase [Rhodanobacter sp.]|jgi:L-ascorbate metabolism protein UlaG (beta-lactamase superfamily)